MEYLLISLGLIWAVTSWMDLKKAKAYQDTVREALGAIEGLTVAIERATKDSPMIIASSKSAKELAKNLSKVIGTTKDEED